MQGYSSPERQNCVVSLIPAAAGGGASGSESAALEASAGGVRVEVLPLPEEAGSEADLLALERLEHWGETALRFRRVTHAETRWFVDAFTDSGKILPEVHLARIFDEISESQGGEAGRQPAAALAAALAVASPAVVLSRLLRNLSAAYRRKGDDDRSLLWASLAEDLSSQAGP